MKILKTISLLFVFILLFFIQPLKADVIQGVHKYILKNGITVLLKEDHSWPTVSVQLWVKTGSANETEKEAGISHLIEHMMFKGTKKRKTGEIARCIEKLGGEINAYTSFDQTVYYVNIPSKHIGVALDVLLDAIQHSVFDPKELKKEKQVVLEEYRMDQDNPNIKLINTMMALAFKVHPYKRPVIGYKSNIKSFKRQDILNYINKWYTPNNIIIVVVGDFDQKKVLKEIKKLTKNFPKRSGIFFVRPKEPEQKSIRKKIMYENVHQTYMDIFWHIPSIKSSDIPILDIISYLLSNGKSSRLYYKLKMRQNLVRSIDSGLLLLKDPGIFYINVLMESKGGIQKVLNIILKEIEKISTIPVSTKELNKAKRQAKADFIYEMEDMSGQARTLGFFEALAGDYRKARKYLEIMESAKPEDLIRVAKKYLKTDNFSIGILAPKNSKIHIHISAPSLTKIILKNGVRLILKEDHRLPIVSFTAVFLGGTRLENKGKWGISDLTSRLLTRGTKNRSYLEIASEVESCGGILEGFSGRNSIGLRGKFLKEDIYKGLSLMTDILLYPIFPESEIKKAKEDIISDIQSKKDYPLPEVFDLFFKTLYKHHPYGHPLTGTIETVRSIRRKDIINWYNKIARPNKLVIAIVGDINNSEIADYLKRKLEHWEKHLSPLPVISPEPPILSPRKVYKKRIGRQDHIILGFLGTSLKSKENLPMEIVNTALSGQGGRLFYELRDKMALAYEVTSFRRPGLETGAFGVYMACAPNKVNLAIKGILDQLRYLRKYGLTSKEIKDAKEYITGNFIMDLQTIDSQAMQMALNELYGLGYKYIYKFPHIIKAISSPQIKEAINKIINLNSYVLIVLGPTAPKNINIR